MSDDVDVLPVNDIREHETGAACPCSPEIEIIGSSLLIIHNSFDGREFFEEVGEFLRNNKNVH